MSFITEKFIIPDEVIDEVSADLGVPIVTLEDRGLTKENLIRLAIKPALRLYYSYYPIIQKEEYKLSSYVEIPFPGKEVFNVAMARVVSITQGTTKTKNPFMNQHIYKRTRSYRSYGHSKDGRDPYTVQGLNLMESIESKSYMTLAKAGNFNIDIQERLLSGYSTVVGTLIVNWAKWSSTWDTVRFEHESDVIDVAKMYALRFLGGLDSQQDSNTGVNADGSVFLSRADTIEDKILDGKWKARIPLVVLR